MKRYICKFFIYSVIFLFLISGENKISVTGISVGFFYALLYCREKPIFYFIPYFVLSFVFYQKITFLLYLVLSVLPAIILMITHYIFNKKFILWVTLLFSIVSQISKFVLFNSYIITIIGCVITAIVFYCSVMFLHPILIRGIRYDMSEKEWAAMLAFIGLIGAGANVFTVFGLSFFYPVVVFLLCFGSCFDKEKTTFSCFIYGLGGSFISQSFYPVGYCAVIVVIFFLFSSVHRIAGGLFSFAVFVGVTYLFEKTFSLWTTVMTGIIFLTVLIPEKVFVFGKMRDGYRGKFALRTIVNRDREEVRKKLSNVAEAFETVKDVLIEEESGILKKKKSRRV